MVSEAGSEVGSEAGSEVGSEACVSETKIRVLAV